MEEWKDIEGFEGIYQISTLNRIKSLGREVIRNNKPMILKEIIMKLHITSQGYLAVRLYRKGKKSTIQLLHRLIAIAFINNPNKEKYTIINHKDGNKLNNNLDNLEWCTSSQNNKHAFDTGLKNPTAKLTIEQVKEIKILLKEGISCSKIAFKYPVDIANIYAIRAGKSWKDIAI